MVKTTHIFIDAQITKFHADRTSLTHIDRLFPLWEKVVGTLKGADIKDLHEPANQPSDAESA